MIVLIVWAQNDCVGCCTLLHLLQGKNKSHHIGTVYIREFYFDYATCATRLVAS